MSQFELDQFFETPSFRWKSFEAEAFPVTAYRYDKRAPKEVRASGLHTAGSNPATRGIAYQFGDDTIFAAASKKGLNHYLHFDSSTYRPINNQYREIAQNNSIEKDIFSENFFTNKNINNPFLYRIKTDTHNSIPFNDFSEQFEERFNKLTINNRSETFMEFENFHKYNDFNNSRDIIFHREISEIRNRMITYKRNDEIHIMNITNRDHVLNAFSPRKGIRNSMKAEFNSLEVLDLA